MSDNKEIHPQKLSGFYSLSGKGSFLQVRLISYRKSLEMYLLTEIAEIKQNKHFVLKHLNG